MRSIDTVEARRCKGLVGDRYHGSRHRQVTIQSREALRPHRRSTRLRVRRRCDRWNITVDTGDIPTKPGSRLRIGEVEFEVVRVAAPCRLDGGRRRSRRDGGTSGRAGSARRVLSSGTIRVGDPVELLDD